MKVVLVIPNFDSYLVAPQLGILYISSYLKKHGVEVVIIEGLRDNLSDKQIMDKVIAENPDAVGIHCLTGFYKQVVKLSNLVKEQGYTCIVGGAHPTFMPYTSLLESKADYVICGEGEVAFLKLAQNNFVNNDIKGVYSLADLKDDDLLADGTPVKKAEYVDNLDEIPFPDWEQIPPSSYPHSPHGLFAKGYPIGVIMASRGCPYQCTFCSSKNFYDKVRFRSPENVVAEIKYQIEEFGIKELQFTDDNLTLKEDYIIKVCNLMIENDIKIPWSTPNGVRADRVNKDIILLMKKAGCYMLDFGIESANPQILKNIKKGETIEQIKNSINIAHEAGMITIGNFIFGLPGETKETIEETINFAVNSKLDRAGFFALRLFPGSDLSNELKTQFKLDYSHSFISVPDWLTGNLTQNDLIRAIQKAYWRFYFRPKRLFNVLRDIPLSQVKYILKCMSNYHLFKLW